MDDDDNMLTQRVDNLQQFLTALTKEKIFWSNELFHFLEIDSDKKEVQAMLKAKESYITRQMMTSGHGAYYYQSKLRENSYSKGGFN